MIHKKQKDTTHGRTEQRAKQGNKKPQHSTTQHNTAPHSTAQHSTAHCCEAELQCLFVCPVRLLPLFLSLSGNVCMDLAQVHLRIACTDSRTGIDASTAAGAAGAPSAGSGSAGGSDGGEGNFPPEQRELALESLLGKYVSGLMIARKGSQLHLSAQLIFFKNPIPQSSAASPR